MSEWLESRERRWLRRHAVFAPFGIFVITALMTYFTEQVAPNTREFWKSSADMVDMGAVLYAMAAVVLEKGGDAVFWALEQRRKRREKFEAEVRAAVLNDLLQAGRERGSQEIEELVERVAREKGIELKG